jgi:hypothetical protein
MIIEISDDVMQNHEAMELCRQIDALAQTLIPERVDIIAKNKGQVIWSNTPANPLRV